MSDQDDKLRIVCGEVEARCATLADQFETATGKAWPCGQGCDHCCRSLPRPPELSELEWKKLDAAIDDLDPELKDIVLLRIWEAAELERQDEPPRHVVCPLLNRDRGMCVVYDARPIACRTYGYYVSEGAGLWCGEIEKMVDASKPDVVFGNQDAVERRLEQLAGPKLSLSSWFALDRE